MFSAIESELIQPGILEQKLAGQKKPLQRLALIDSLTSHYAYTNVYRAKELLKEQWELLKLHEVEDFKFHYFLNKMVVQNQLYEFDEAANIAAQAIEYVKEIGSVKQLIEIYVEYAGICTNQQLIDKAEEFLLKAFRILNKYPDIVLESHLACRKGFMLLHTGSLSAATEQFLKADSLLNSAGTTHELKEEYLRTLIYSGLGQVYERNEDYEKCSQAYLQVVFKCERLGMSNRLAWHYLNVGRAFLARGENVKAKAYLQKVVDVRDDLSLKARASAYANLGFCSFEEGAFKEALELLDRAEELHNELNENDYFNLGVIASWRGQIETEQGNYKEALAAFTDAHDFAETLGDNGILANVFSEIATLYACQNDFEEAYAYQCAHDRSMELHIQDMDRNHQQELEVKYEAARKQQTAELLQLKATRLQLKALRAQMNPHFIYNALNSIQNFITSKDAATASRYLAKFAKLMRQSLEYSDKEVISLEDELEFLEDYLFINEHLRFEERMTFTITTDDEIEEDIMGVPTMIVQPYVENALEHGLRSKKGGTISVHFKLLDEETILCTVEDNGIGREKAIALQKNDPDRENYRSRGTQITETRLELLRQSNDHEVLVETIDLFDEKTGKAKGTRVVIKIPIVEIQI